MDRPAAATGNVVTRTRRPAGTAAAQPAGDAAPTRVTPSPTLGRCLGALIVGAAALALLTGCVVPGGYGMPYGGGDGGGGEQMGGFGMMPGFGMGGGWGGGEGWHGGEGWGGGEGD